MKAFTESCFDTVDLQRLQIASEIGMDRETIHDLRYPGLPYTVPEHVYNLRMCILKENERCTFHDEKL